MVFGRFHHPVINFKQKYSVELPEEERQPWKALKDLFVAKSGRGIGNSKPLFAKKMIDGGFEITNAAKNINCKSAKYFMQKLEALAAGRF